MALAPSDIEFRRFALHIAAILTVPVEDRTAKSFAGESLLREDGVRSYAKTDLLGANLLERTLLRLGPVATQQPAVLPNGSRFDHVIPSRSPGSTAFMDAWEKSISSYISGGADVLVLVRVGTYTDLDYAELLSFHSSTGSPLTQAYDADGSLDIAVVNASLLRNNDGLVRRALRRLFPQQRRFYYTGYVNRLRRPPDLFSLMSDGLHGRCGLRPSGTELRPGVWCGDDVDLDSTVSIHGTAFIGAGSRVAAGCTIAGTSSVERDCQIDCATLIEDSFVLQGSYVGVALDVRRSIVGNKKLFNVDRNVEVSVSDSRLLGRNSKPIGFYDGLLSLLGGEVRAGD